MGLGFFWLGFGLIGWGFFLLLRWVFVDELYYWVGGRDV